MSSRQLKLGLAAVSVIAGSIAFNLLVLQPNSGRSGRPERAYRGLETLPGTASNTLKPASAAHKPAGEAVPEGETQAVPARVQPSRAGGLETQTTITRSVQEELAARGYYSGERDGIAGLVTRAAVMDFEYLNGMPVTGEPSPAVLKMLATAAAREEVLKVDVQRFDAGKVGPEAEAVIRTVQHSLERLGYAPGIADGRIGEATAAAIRQFERDSALTPSGRITAALVRRLGERTGAGRVAQSE